MAGAVWMLTNKYGSWSHEGCLRGVRVLCTYIFFPFSGNTTNTFWQGTLRHWMHVVVETKFPCSTLLWIWRSAATTPTSSLWLLWYVQLLTYSYISKFPAGCYQGDCELHGKYGGIPFLLLCYFSPSCIFMPLCRHHILEGLSFSIIFIDK